MTKPKKTARAEVWTPGLAEFAKLVRLCPKAVSPRDYGIEKFAEHHEMHLIVVDRNSYLAALVTLSVFGKHVAALGQMLPNLHMAFENEDISSEAVVFYNHLPQQMKNYTGRGSEFMPQ